MSDPLLLLESGGGVLLEGGPVTPAAEPGASITGPWQVELRSVLMDARACEGLVITEFLTGFGVPAGRVSTVLRPMQHGAFPGPQYMDERTMTLGVAAVGDSWADLLTYKTDLGAAFSPVPDWDSDYVIPLVFTLGDTTQWRVYGRPTRAEWGYQTAMRTVGKASKAWADAAVCEFVCSDPIIYLNTAATATTTLGSTVGGLALPHSFPHSFGTALSGAAYCQNTGNVTVYPTITVTAGASGATGVVLRQDTTGDEWSITLALNSGESLVVDMAAHTVLLNGTASRAPFVNRPPSVWWGLEPGDNYVILEATGADTTAEVVWRSGYLI